MGVAGGQHRGQDGVGADRQHERQPAGPEPLPEDPRRRRRDAQRPGLRHVREQHRDRLLGWAALGRKQALDGVRQLQPRGDPVDRVRGDRHDPAGAQQVGGLHPGRVAVGDDPREARGWAGAGHAAVPVPSAARSSAWRTRAASSSRAAFRRASASGARASASISAAAPSASTGSAM